MENKGLSFSIGGLTIGPGNNVISPRLRRSVFKIFQSFEGVVSGPILPWLFLNTDI